MREKARTTQPRDRRRTVRLTAEEDDALEGLAAVRDTTASDLLRSMSLREIVRQWHRVEEKIERSRSGKANGRDEAAPATTLDPTV